MNAIDTLINISNTKLINADNLRFCLVASNKVPFTVDGVNAKPNSLDDFVEFEKILDAKNLENYAGIGISIKASNVCAIDVDHCFKEPFALDSMDERGKYVYEHFKDLAYIEFSFSGCGMRVLFMQDNIENYNDKYYIKNSICNIEYYQPSGNARYVTVTGKVIADNDIKSNINFKSVIIEFLDKYMVHNKAVEKPKIVNSANNDKDMAQLMKIVKSKLFHDSYFQMLWFDDRKEFASGKGYPGTGESEHDLALLSYIYVNITQNKELVKQLFEESLYFKTKDYKHKNKWNNQDFRYFNLLFKQLS